MTRVGLAMLVVLLLLPVEQAMAMAQNRKNEPVASGDAPEIVLVENGHPHAVVVLPDAAGPTATYAAHELVEHIRQATGVTLPIAKESQIPDGFRHRVFLGVTDAARKNGIDPAALGDDAFLLRTVGPDLFVLGGDDGGNPLSPGNSSSGTLFGVYEILERVAGVRWLWPGALGTYVPSASALRVGKLDETVNPKLLWNTWVLAPVVNSGDYDHDRNVFLRRHRVSNHAHIKPGHFFGTWWGKYGEKHPEWFQLNSDGTRGPGGWSKMQDRVGALTHRAVQLCVSNKELQRFIVDHYAPRAPVFVAKGPGGKPAVHFSRGARMFIKGFANDRLAGKSFTVLVNSVSDTPNFGLSGNNPDGTPGEPRLYLIPSVYAYRDLANEKGERLQVPAAAFSPGQAGVYAYVYDAEAKAMRLFKDGALLGERRGVDPVAVFFGGALAIPFKADSSEQEGYLLDLAVFDHALSPSQIAEASRALEEGSELPSAGLTLRVAARDLDEPGADGKPVARWPSAVGPSFEASSVLDLSNADNPEFCLCPDCMAMDGPQPVPFPTDYVHGGRIVSDRYAKFWQQIYEMAKEKSPDLRVVTYLYRETFAAPLTGIELNKNFFGEFVPHVRKLMFFPMPEEAMTYMKDQWLGWQKTGMTLAYRPNYFNGGYIFPFLDLRQSAEFLKFAHEHGMVGWYGDTLRGSWAVRGPMLYAHMRLLQNPHLSVDAVIEEYYSGFGPASDEVARYFDYWEKFSRKVTQASNWPSYGLLGQLAAARIYTPEVLAPAAEILQQAMAAAEKDPNPDFARRVQFLQDGLQEASLTLKLFGLLDAGFNPSLGDRKAFAATAEARRQMVEFQRQHAKDYLSDYHYYETNESAGDPNYRRDAKLWNKLDQTLAGGFEKAGGKELAKAGPWAPWLFRKDPGDVGVREEWFRPGLDTGGWKPIQVPALWSAAGIPEHQGYAWYRTAFQVPATWQGESISLTFGAVDEQAWIYVNGVLVGEHSVASEKQPVEKLWDESFAVEVKPEHLKYGDANSLVVRVHNAKADGGIHRPVTGSTIGTEPLFPLPDWKE